MFTRLMPILLAPLFAAGTLSAQSGAPTAGVSAMFGTGLIDSELGLTVGVGAAAIVSRVAARGMVDLHLVQDDNDGATWEPGLGGPECIDDDSGEVVSDSNCSIARTLVGGTADLSFLVPAFSGLVHLGSGFRVGPGSTAYGVVGYGFEPGSNGWHLLFRVAAGRELLGLHAIASIPIGMR